MQPLLENKACSFFCTCEELRFIYKNQRGENSECLNEFIYTSGWEKFEQYCKELYRGYLNRYCQGNEKACEDEINSYMQWE